MSEKKTSEIDSKARINAPDSEKKELEKTDLGKKKSIYLEGPFIVQNEALNSQYPFSAAIGSALNPSVIPLSSMGSWINWATQLTPSVFIPTETLNSEQSQLRKEVRELAQSLEETKRESEKYIESKKQLEVKLKVLEQKTILSYILSNIRPDAQEMIFKSEGFKNLFEKTTTCYSFVLSIDIRRSTELMLKARLPNQFAQFIRGLCVGLSEIIIGNYGVFDKFTGDGVLAYFPDFYSGSDAGLFALDSALKAHTFFRKHYEEHRNCFTSVLSDLGLGIGIDYGKTYMVKIQGSLTLVGTPVVYACRFSGAKAGDTLLNQPAFEIVFNKYRSCFNFDETTIAVKNEGDTLAYRIASNKATYIPVKPDWEKLVAEFSNESKGIDLK